ncbi:MAG TPA: hypothetical protein VF950_15040 [Planctomycetota bacterium]
MTCDDVESELDAWGVGLLERDERRELETHLAYCGACEAQASSLRRIVGRLSTTPARVDAAVLEERVLAAAFPRPRRPSLAAAAAILCLFVPWEPHEAPPAVVLVPATPVEAPVPPPAVEAEIDAPELPLDVPPPAPATEAVAWSWEEATAVPLPPEEVALLLWGVELEARETFDPSGDVDGGSVHAGAAFVGWSRDDELGGAALVGLCLKF